MSEAFQPTLEYFGATVKPGVPAGTMIEEISFAPSVPGAGDRGDGDQRGDVGAGVGDERLGAVDHPLVAVEHARVVGVPPASEPRAGLGQPERAERLAASTASAATARFCSSVPNR